MADGLASAPGLPFASDADTGLYRVGSDQIGLSTGGAERLRVAATAIRAFEPIWVEDGLTFDLGSNTMRNYAEGTWTPTVGTPYGFTVGPSPSYSGWYLRVGDLVHVRVELDFDVNEAVAVNDRAIMGNLPFSVAAAGWTSIGAAGTCWVYSSLSSGVNAFGHVGVNVSGTNWYFVITSIPGTAPNWASHRLRATFTYIT